MNYHTILYKHSRLILLLLSVAVPLLYLRSFHNESHRTFVKQLTDKLLWQSNNSVLQILSLLTENRTLQVNEDMFIILIWEDLWEDYSDAHMSNDFLSMCTDLKCSVTFNRHLLPKAAAVLQYDRTLRPKDLPPRTRRPDQHYVFFLMESPHHISQVAFRLLARNYYTLTMSYRRDSDIYTPFGFLQPRKKRRNTPHQIWKSIALSKPKGAVWMGSFCSSPGKREVYISKLKQYMELDVYGRCGNLKCKKEATAYMKHDPCEQMLKKNYKFYIAFENSVCKDYMTEKVFNRLDSHLVPVVFKRSVAEPLLPKGSFIAADDFKGPKELADYLNYLNQNVTAYTKYYEWKDHFEVVPFPGGFHMGMCQLCARIRADRDVKAIYPSESAADIHKWYIGRGECIPDYGILLSREKKSG